MTWKKDGKQIQSGKESFEIPNAFQGRLLIIITVQKNIHDGQYTCEAENSENAGNPIKHNINLQVEGTKFANRIVDHFHCQYNH